MAKKDEVLVKLLNLETTIEEIYKDITRIRRENNDMVLDQFHILTKLEEILYFVQLGYQTFNQQKEKIIDEILENNNRV